MNKKYLFPAIFSVSILSVFYLSTKLIIYSFLKPLVGILNAYFIDQLLYLGIFFATLIFGIAIKKIAISKKDIFYFLGILIFTFLVLKGLLSRYFIGDDLFIMLPDLNDPRGIDYRYISKGDYYFYHFLAFSLLFDIFKYHAIYYSVFALSMIALASTCISKLLAYLSGISKFKNKLLLILFISFYISSPNILGHFHYLEHSVAIGYIVVGTALSIYWYLKFLRGKGSNIIYFLLSYLLMLFLLKTAMTRIAFLPVMLVILELFHLRQQKSRWGSSAARIFFLLVPFLLMTGSYFTLSVDRRMYYIEPRRFIDFERIFYAISSLFPFLIPNQFLPSFVLYLRDFFHYSPDTSNFLVKNLFFTGGLAAGILFTFVLLILHIKKYKIKYILLFWTFSIISMLFYTLAGGGADIGFKEFDYSIIHYYSAFTAVGYVMVPLMFLLITLYLFIIALFKNVESNVKKIVYYSICLILFLVIVSNLSYGKSVISEANIGYIAYQTAAENILRIVPDNSEKKVLYSTEGEIHAVKFLGIDDFRWFYKNEAPMYIISKEELVKYLQDNKIYTNNLYAFYFEQPSLIFIDKSKEIRGEMENYLIK